MVDWEEFKHHFLDELRILVHYAWSCAVLILALQFLAVLSPFVFDLFHAFTFLAIVFNEDEHVTIHLTAVPLLIKLLCTLTGVGLAFSDYYLAYNVVYHSDQHSRLVPHFLYAHNDHEASDGMAGRRILWQVCREFGETLGILCVARSLVLVIFLCALMMRKFSE